jgi:phosphate:Na+ symporter
MTHLLHLLAAVALLVWGTHLVRAGVLRVFGARLRELLARSISNRFSAAACGLAVTAVVQSSTATALIVSSFVGQRFVALPLALAAMLGADVGTSLMAVVFSLDLSWLSPALILVGVVVFITRQSTPAGRVGRIFIGLGLILHALRLVSESTEVMTRSPLVQAMLGSVANDPLLLITAGVALTVVAYSSLAVVLLTAAMASSGLLPLDSALGLVLGANLGSGLIAVLTTARSAVEVRQVPLGNLVFKVIGILLAAPLVQPLIENVRDLATAPQLVVLFHLAFNVFAGVLLLGFTHPVARLVNAWLPPPKDHAGAPGRRHRLDPSLLGTPSLAIACATREAMHLADLVESMLLALPEVIRDNQLERAQELRKLDDRVDELYSAIKYYLTKIPMDSLSEAENRRWSDIISFTINMEQVGDIVESILIDIEERKISTGRDFSSAGMAEICELHARLLDNQRLAMSVFLTGSLADARELLKEKTRFRDLEQACARSHLARLADNSVQSVETSSLHLDLLSGLKRINSHVCSIAYPVLEAAGVLAPSRLREEPMRPALTADPRG